MTEANSERRSVDRLINFSDAVVAVAITLLALPLVDIGAPKAGQRVWDVLSANAGQIYSFAFTFLVVIVMWLAHNRILNPLRHLDPVIVWLNTFWLLLIVLLPWISSMYGESEVFGAHGAGGTAMVYWLLLAAISLLGTGMAWRMRRRTDLSESAAPTSTRLLARGPILAGYFVVIAVASVLTPALSVWLPLGIIPLSFLLRPHTAGVDA